MKQSPNWNTYTHTHTHTTQLLSQIVTQVGNNASAIDFPVFHTDRAILSAGYGSILKALQSVPYSFSFFAYYEVVQARILGVGSLVNPAGNVVHPSKDTIRSAASEFISSGAGEPFDFILG